MVYTIHPNGIYYLPEWYILFARRVYTFLLKAPYVVRGAKPFSPVYVGKFGEWPLIRYLCLGKPQTWGHLYPLRIDANRYLYECPWGLCDSLCRRGDPPL